jgi:hypothetical protein
MNEKNFSKEWASLSSEQQAAFRDWVKANLEAKKAKGIFLEKYISKELRQSQAEEFKIDSSLEADQKDFITLSQNLFADFVLLVEDRCHHCLEIDPDLWEEQRACYWRCITELVVNWEVEIA